MYYIGLDVHKKTISYCVKDAAGKIHQEGRLQRRRREIGVRIALGAMRRDVLQLIFGESLRVAVLGLAFGLPLSLAVAYGMRSQLYQLSSFDLASFTAALAITLVVAVVASVLPARTAANLNPVDTIRSE